MKTINLTFKCIRDKCPYTQYPLTCIQPSDEATNQVCEYLTAYITPQPEPATPECLHRQHKCQECREDHTTDWLYCTSPKKRQKT